MRDVQGLAAAGDRAERPGAPVVELRAVSKRFGAVEALHEVSFTVRPGEVVALLGPNGAGKTTAISVMLGLRRPTSGQVRLLGMDPHASPHAGCSS